MADETTQPQEAEISMEDLRAAMRGEEPGPAAEQTATPQPETAEIEQKPLAADAAGEELAKSEEPETEQAPVAKQAQEQPKEPEQPKPSREDRRFSKLTRARDEAQARAEAAEAELARLRMQPQPGAPAPQPVADPSKPKPPNLEEMEWAQQAEAQAKYLEDLTEWKANQKISEFKQQQADAELKRQEEVVSASWRQKALSYSAKNEEFGDAAKLVGDAFRDRPGATDIIKDSEVGPELVMRLYEQEEELNQMLQITNPMRLARKLGAIEAEILAEKKAASVPKPSVRPVPAKPLPAPPKTVGGAGGPATVPLGEEADMASFKAKFRSLGANW